MFDLDETEVFIPENTLEGEMEDGGAERLPNVRNTVIGFPSAWANSFGPNYYTHAQARELAAFLEDGTWQLAEQSQPFRTTGLKVTSYEETQSTIQQLMIDISGKKQERGRDHEV